MSILFYKKPEFSNAEGALNQSSCQKYVERAACSRAAIPDELSFKNIIEDRCLPPMSLQDFLDYLIYVTHDAENLQFYLWYKDYCKRFNTTPAWKRDLSPMWSETGNKTNTANKTTQIKKTPTPSSKSSPMLPLSRFASPLPSPALSFEAKPLPSAPSPAEQFDHFSFKSPSKETFLSPPPSTPSKYSSHHSEHDLDTDITSTTQSDTISVDEKTRDKQPFREEIERIADHYLRVDSPRELNLSSRERENVLRAVEQTTHPTAFLEAASLVETTLRYHSHRNFVRWSICNGNKPRVLVLRGLAVFVLSCTLALAFFLIISSYSRWLRLTVIPLCFFASVNLIAARQGLCVLLHRRRTREARPWELDDPHRMGFGRMDTLAQMEEAGTAVRTPRDAVDEKQAFFGPRNEFRHEPWVKRWKGRSMWQKIRIQKIKVGPGGLRNVQDRIIWQAEAWGSLVTLVFTGVVCGFPEFGLY